MKISGVFVARSEPQRIKDDLLESVDQLVVDPEDTVDYTFIRWGQPRYVRIERKEVTDLVNSFLHRTTEEAGENLLMYQMRRLASNTDPGTLKVLLIEGHIYNRQGFVQLYNRPTKVTFNSVDNLLMTLQRFGIVIARSPSIVHTANRMASIAYNWLYGGEKAPLITLPKAPVPQLRTLMTFPGVGYKRAKKLLEDAGDLETAITALLAGTANVGKATDKKVQEYLLGGAP